MENHLLSAEMTERMLTPHAGNEHEHYGYGFWLDRKESGVYIPHFEGCDPGVSFVSSYDTTDKAKLILVSNYGDDVWKLWHLWLMNHK